MAIEEPTAGTGAVRLDSRQIRTLAHPLRARLLGALRVDGPATATKLAQALDTNTGATSYHLRRLAEVGLVVQEPDLGAGRQRWWRAAHRGSSWRPIDFDDDPDASAASDWIQNHQMRLAAEYAERWLSTQHGYPREWREAAEVSDALLTLSPQRLRALNDELWQVIMRYREESSSDEPGAEQVLLFIAGYPRVEQTR